MIKNCSLCGNYHRNIAFRGGYICLECREWIRALPDAADRAHAVIFSGAEDPVHSKPVFTDSASRPDDPFH